MTLIMFLVEESKNIGKFFFNFIFSNTENKIYSEPNFMVSRQAFFDMSEWNHFLYFDKAPKYMTGFQNSLFREREFLNKIPSSLVSDSGFDFIYILTFFLYFLLVLISIVIVYQVYEGLDLLPSDKKPITDLHYNPVNFYFFKIKDLNILKDPYLNRDFLGTSLVKDRLLSPSLKIQGANLFTMSSILFRLLAIWSFFFISIFFNFSFLSTFFIKFLVSYSFFPIIFWFIILSGIFSLLFHIVWGIFHIFRFSFNKGFFYFVGSFFSFLFVFFCLFIFLGIFLFIFY